MDPIYTSIATIFWYNVYELFIPEIGNKLALNTTAFLHCCSIIFFYILNELHNIGFLQFDNYFSYIVNVSVGFYFYDIFNYSFFKKNEIGYIIHHIAGISAMIYFKEIPNIEPLLLWIEISNIPLYFVYHYLHLNNSFNEVIIWKKIQKTIYIPIRTIVVSYYYFEFWFDNTFQLSLILKATCTLIYLIGIYWSWIIYHN